MQLGWPEQNKQGLHCSFPVQWALASTFFIPRLVLTTTWFSGMMRTRNLRSLIFFLSPPGWIRPARLGTPCSAIPCCLWGTFLWCLVGHYEGTIDSQFQMVLPDSLYLKRENKWLRTHNEAGHVHHRSCNLSEKYSLIYKLYIMWLWMEGE